MFEDQGEITESTVRVDVAWMSRRDLLSLLSLFFLMSGFIIIIFNNHKAFSFFNKISAGAQRPIFCNHQRHLCSNGCLLREKTNWSLENSFSN